jgi:hypothetical protein
MTGDNTPSTSTSHPSVVSVSDPDYLLIQQGGAPVENPVQSQEPRGNQSIGDQEGHENEEREEHTEANRRQEIYPPHGAMGSMPLRGEQDMLKNRSSENNSNSDGSSRDNSNEYQGSHNANRSNRNDSPSNSNGNNTRRRRG